MYTRIPVLMYGIRDLFGKEILDGKDTIKKKNYWFKSEL